MCDRPIPMLVAHLVACAKQASNIIVNKQIDRRLFHFGHLNASDGTFFDSHFIVKRTLGHETLHYLCSCMSRMRVVGWCCSHKLLVVACVQCPEVVVTVGRTPAIEGVEEMGV